MTKCRKMPILHHIIVNGHNCGSDAMTFVGCMSSLDLILTVGYKFGLLLFSLSEIGGGGELAPLQISNKSLRARNDFLNWKGLESVKTQKWSKLKIITSWDRNFVHSPPPRIFERKTWATRSYDTRLGFLLLKSLSRTDISQPGSRVLRRPGSSQDSID